MMERIVRPDGDVRYLSSNGEVVRDADGTPVRMRGTCIDITDRVLAEQERERTADRFRGLVESAPDAILVLDDAGRILEANPRAHQLLGGDPGGPPDPRAPPRRPAAGRRGGRGAAVSTAATLLLDATAGRRRAGRGRVAGRGVPARRAGPGWRARRWPPGSARHSCVGARRWRSTTTSSRDWSPRRTHWSRRTRPTTVVVPRPHARGRPRDDGRPARPDRLRRRRGRRPGAQQRGQPRRTRCRPPTPERRRCDPRRPRAPGPGRRRLRGPAGAADHPAGAAGRRLRRRGGGRRAGGGRAGPDAAAAPGDARPRDAPDGRPRGAAADQGRRLPAYA